MGRHLGVRSGVRSDEGFNSLEFLALVPIFIFLLLMLGLGIRVNILKHSILGAARSGARAATVAGRSQAVDAADKEVRRALTEFSDVCAKKADVETVEVPFDGLIFIRVTVTCETKPIGFGLKSKQTATAEEVVDRAKESR
jgi:hypothetical protein